MSSGAGTSEAGGLGAARSFLILFVRDESFALPLEAVREVIRLPDLAVVPRGPASLAGLANLHGRVLPVADLGRLLRREAALPTEAARVLVVAGQAPFGLLVDRVGRLISAEADRLIPAGDEVAPADAEMLDGMIRGREGEAAIPVLEPTRLLRRDFARSSRPAVVVPITPIAARAADAAPPADGARVFVSFAAADREYALPIEVIEEIAPAPDRLAPVAQAEAHVLGIIARRGSLLPLVSLCVLLGLPPAAAAGAEGERRGKLVVVRLDGVGVVGLIVDRQGAVLRVPAALVDPVPPLVARRRPGLEIAAICRLDGGRRLVAVLSPERLFRLDGLRQAATTAITANVRNREGNEVGATDSAAVPDDEERFVVFRLGEDEFGVPIAAVEEVLRVPETLTPMPKAPAFVEGIMSLRGAVLPVVDQRRRFGLPPHTRTGRERIMVHRVGETRAGFIVDAVTEVMRVPSTAVGPAPELAREHPSPLIARVVNLERRRRLVLILDTARLLERDETGALATGLAGEV